MTDARITSWVRRPLLDPESDRIDGRTRGVAGYARKAKLREALDLVRLVSGIAPDAGDVGQHFHAVMQKSDDRLAEGLGSFDLRCLAAASLHCICARDDLPGRAAALAVESLCVVRSAATDVLLEVRHWLPRSTLDLPAAHLPEAPDALAVAKAEHGEASKGADVNRKLAALERYVPLLETRVSALSRAASTVDQSAGGWRCLSAVLAWLLVAETKDGRRFSDLTPARAAVCAPLSLISIAGSAAAYLPIVDLMSSVLLDRVDDEITLAELRTEVTEPERAEMAERLRRSSNRDLASLSDSLVGNPAAVRDRASASTYAIALYQEGVLLELGREEES